jgi:hypothetical protein
MGVVTRTTDIDITNEIDTICQGTIGSPKGFEQDAVTIGDEGSSRGYTGKESSVV